MPKIESSKTKTSKIEPYDDFKEIAPNLYCLDGDWQDSPFRRRMTVIRLRSGGLLIHNAIQLREEDYTRLDRLGKVEVIVAPNRFHSSDAHFYKLRYPFAKLYVSSASAKALRRKCEVAGVLPDWDDVLRSEVDCLEMGGTRFLGESVFFHRASKTLITTDLIFNVQADFDGFELAFAKWNLIHRRFGPSKIFKVIFAKNKEEVSNSVQKILEWDFDRVIMNHGVILNTGGKAAVKKGFEEIGILAGAPTGIPK